MPKNREAPKIRPAKEGDNFFSRPKKKFDPRNRYQNPKFRNESVGVMEQSFRPSQSGSSDFFVTPDSSKLSEKIPIKQIQDLKPSNVKQEKRPFDKKKYRLQKYSKKYKLEQWEQKRKTAILRGYYRTLKEDEPKFDTKSIYDKYQDENDSDGDITDGKTNEENENNLNMSINLATSSRENIARNSKERKGKAFKKAYQEFQRIKEEKQKKREDMLRQKAERKEALQAYKKKKVEKFKKLNRKTKKGQPIMKERIELLLENIQSGME